MLEQEEISKFLNKIKEMEKNEKVDLSSDEDLSIAVMNLISIEEHLFFTWNKTGKNEYLDLLSQTRENRKLLMKKLIKDYEGEVWCISKHLLAASMRLMEVGTKMLGKGDKPAAEELFKKSYNLYSLFWGINFGIVKTDQISKTLDEQNEILFVGEQEKPKEKGRVGIFDKLGEIVKKALDCCKE